MMPHFRQGEGTKIVFRSVFVTEGAYRCCSRYGATPNFHPISAVRLENHTHEASIRRPLSPACLCHKWRSFHRAKLKHRRSRRPLPFRLALPGTTLRPPWQILQPACLQNRSRRRQSWASSVLEYGIIPSPTDPFPRIFWGPYHFRCRWLRQDFLACTNSGKLDDLVKDGKIYLSLSDAILLALENNYDIAIARYNLDIADTDILLRQVWRLLLF